MPEARPMLPAHPSPSAPPPIVVMVPGQPKAWERSGHKGRQHYESAEIVQWKHDAGWRMKAACRMPLVGPVAMVVRAIYPCPLAEVKQHGHQRRFRAARADADNIAKLVMDTGNGLLYRDDAQIVRLVVEKYVGRASEQPHTEILVFSVTDDEVSS